MRVVRKPSTASRRPGVSSMPVAEVDPLEDRDDLVQAVAAPRADDEREVDLRRRDGPRRRSCDQLGEPENSSGASSSARTFAGRPSSARAAPPRSRSARPGELERVGERLAPVGERSLGQPPNRLELGAPGAQSGGRRRARSRRWAAAGSTSARRDGSRCARQRAAGRPTPRRSPSSPAAAKKRSATSRWTITHQRSTVGQRREALDDDRRGDVVGQVGDELPRRRIEPACRRSSASPKTSSTFVLGPQPLAQDAARGFVELDRVDDPDARRRGSSVSTPRPGPISRTTSSGLERGEPADHVEDVLVDEPVLAELAFRARTLTARPKSVVGVLLDPRFERRPRPRRAPRPGQRACA